MREIALGSTSNVNAGVGRDGDINSHNHPTLLPPSGGDIETTLRFWNQTTRVVLRNKATGKGEIYTLKAAREVERTKRDKIYAEFMRIARYGKDATRESRLAALENMVEETENVINISKQVTGIEPR